MATTPYVGSKLHKEYGSIGTGVRFGYFNMGFFVFLFLFNCGPLVFKENKRFEDKLYELKNKAI